MGRTTVATVVLACALALPVNAIPATSASAQDPLGGAILGGAAGAILGGALGGGRGAATGAIIGGATGAIIGSQGQARPGGYYFYDNGCYLQRGDGAFVAVSPGYCGAPPPRAVRAPAMDADDAYCMQRYRSYDPASRTFMGYDGVRRPCP